MAQTPPDEVDPVVLAKFRIARSDRIVTAGSCFAQHLARRLSACGLQHLVTELAHPLLPAELAHRFGYGVYSARYGNIYTPRQLLQLVRRAYGTLKPLDDVWQQDGRYYDPYRPAIQPNGFATLREFEVDRERHFAAVRSAFQAMNMFVFTLGLTECWSDKGDGCVYPVCPGTVAGRFDPARHVLINLTLADIVADFRAAVDDMRALNEHFRIILTVSPVPLAATALDRHVLVSTTYSKSVLRVAAEMLAEDPQILYFPSYEIVTGAFSRGRYYERDLRSITQAGVDHVMRLFMQHATEAEAPADQQHPEEPAYDHFERQRQAVAVLCEEEALDQA